MNLRGSSQSCWRDESVKRKEGWGGMLLSSPLFEDGTGRGVRWRRWRESSSAIVSSWSVRGEEQEEARRVERRSDRRRTLSRRLPL
jgi:hypothetical protein